MGVYIHQNLPVLKFNYGQLITYQLYLKIAVKNCPFRSRRACIRLIILPSLSSLSLLLRSFPGPLLPHVVRQNSFFPPLYSPYTWAPISTVAHIYVYVYSSCLCHCHHFSVAFSVWLCWEPLLLVV